jgi:hypothetical protein
MFPDVYWKDGKPTIPFISDTELVDFLVEYVLDNYEEDSGIYISKNELLSKYKNTGNTKFNCVWNGRTAINGFLIELGLNNPVFLRKSAANRIKELNPVVHEILSIREKTT